MAEGLPPEAVNAQVEAMFKKLADEVSVGQPGRARATAQPAPGDHRPRGAGRDAFAAPARRDRREAAPRGAPHRRDRAPRGHRRHERHPLVLDHRRARRPQPAGGPAQHPPRRDESRHHWGGGNGHAVRRRRGDGGLRRPRAPGRPRRPRRRRGGRDARDPGRDQRSSGRRAGPARLRARHRPLHRRGGRRAAGLRGAPRVHARRRHGQPLPATPAARLGRRDRDLGSHARRALR